MVKLSRDGPTNLKAASGEVASGKIRGMGKVDKLKFETTGTMYGNCQL